MKDKHTPGPWKVDGTYIYEVQQDKILAEVETYNNNELPYEANARLIAAAPEMLDLLGECLEQLEALHYLYEGEFSERIETADKAAVKAWKLIAKLTAE